MKKLYELDANKEFGDESNATESGALSGSEAYSSSDGIIVGDFEAVSGSGIGGSLEDDETVENNLQEMLALINSKTGQDAEEFARQEAERQAYLDEEDRKVEEAKRRFNQERYEREQAALAERNERERREREEAERLEAERQEKSFFHKLSKKLKIVSNGYKEKKEEESFQETEAAFNPSEEIERKEAEKESVSEVASSVEEREEEDDYGFVSAEEEMDLSGFVTLDDKEEEILKEAEPEKENLSAAEETRNQSGAECREEKKGLFSMLSRAKEEKQLSLSKQKISKRRERVESPSAEPDWKYIATHDDATGLLNARAYKDDLAYQKNTLGVIFFDINGLRLVNEANGRAAGDRVVLNVSKVLSDVYGKEHLYRIGGGEFACIVPSPGRKFTDNCIINSGKVHNAMAKATKEDPDKALHSVSIGYACGDGDATVEEVAKVADYAMYQNKKAYKNAHAVDTPPRPGEKPAKKAVEKEVRKQDHDEMLSKDQQELKGRIREGHSKVSRSFTTNLMREIQKKAGEIEAILIASPTFDNLFVITDIDDFLDMMEENQGLIDYSYFYVVYQGGTQYYGADEYYDKVTDLFRNVADALLSGRFRSEKDVQAIPGINIFKNVYV